jgi:CheY-like chemotaxis protein
MKSILFIEARRPGGSLALSVLGRAGYLVTTARNAGEAFSRARQGAPDLIVTGEPDHGVSGETLLKALRRMPGLAETPILALRPREGEEEGAGRGQVLAGGLDDLDWDTPPYDAPPVDGAPDEIVRTPVNPFELVAKVRFLLNEEIRRPPPRLSLKREVELEAGEVQARASLVNLSGSGVLLETPAWALPAALPEGPVRLRFRLPETELLLEPEGRVIRRTEAPGEPARIALEFLEMDPDSQRALEDFIFLKG